MKRRTYYDHEPAYRSQRGKRYTGWNPPDCADAFAALEDFLASPWCPPAGRALDLGCGGGEACLRLAELGWEAVGLDFSPTAIALARQNARSAGVEVELLTGDAVQPLLTPLGSFDLVIDNHVLHCLIEVEHRHSFLSNAHAALRSGGILFSANMSADARLDYASHGINPITRVDAHRTRYWATKEELLGELHAAGFLIRHVQSYEDPEQHGMGDELVVYAQKRRDPLAPASRPLS
jgi:2-polyprenyl-3-methyl-5-hydroxy-6-metoxy-1,4-benzoquinol methylase